MDGIIIFVAQDLVWVVAAAAVVSLFWVRSIRAFALAVVSLPVSYIVAKVVGHFYSHIQPFAAQGYTPLIPHVVDNSFPSDHMLIAGVLASVVFTYNRWLGIVLWILAAAVGIARVAAGLHYTLDVVASAIIAIGVVYLGRLVISRLFQQ